VMLATQRVLTRLGYSVLTATSAEAALHQLQDYAGGIDLLLSDVVLPGLDGVALARRLCQERPKLKVLFMSGYSEQTLRLPELMPGGFALVEKPFTASALAQAVRDALGRT
jgi:two-component system, cell cycle sensor histidine kinase and response regulator CckA